MIPQAAFGAGAACIAILAIVGIAARLYATGFRRDAFGTNGRTLVRLETLALDPRRRIHLIQCDGRRVILLTGGHQDLVVGWMADP